MLELKDVSYTVQKENESLDLLTGIGFRTNPSHFMAVVGPSGCGKTTLLKIVAGIYLESGGEIFWKDRNLATEGDLEPSEIGYVPQFSIAYDHLTVLESVETAARLRVRTHSLDDLYEISDRVLASVGLEEIAERKVKVLSGGQKRRLGLAMELVSNPSLLLCDEVTSGLDPKSEREILHLLHHLSKQNDRVVVSVTHSLSNLELYDSVLVLHAGHAAYHGPPEYLTHYFSVEHAEDVYPRLAKRKPWNWHDSWKKHGHDYSKLLVTGTKPEEDKKKKEHGKEEEEDELAQATQTGIPARKLKAENEEARKLRRIVLAEEENENENAEDEGSARRSRRERLRRRRGEESSDKPDEDESYAARRRRRRDSGEEPEDGDKDARGRRRRRGAGDDAEDEERDGTRAKRRRASSSEEGEDDKKEPRGKRRDRAEGDEHADKPDADDASQAAPLPGLASQFMTLLGRRWKIFFRDRTQLVLHIALLLGFPVLVVLFALDGVEQLPKLSDTLPQTTVEFKDEIAKKGDQVEIGGLVSGLVMFQVILLTLMGSNNSSREIAAERLIYEKERLGGVRPASYLASKICFVGLLVLAQSLWMAFFVRMITKVPGDFMYQALFLILVNAAMTAVCLGISATMKSADQASLLSIYLVGFQLPLSGALLALPNYIDQITKWFIAAYWGWSGYLSQMQATGYYDAVKEVSKPTELMPTTICIYVLAIHTVLGLLITYVGLKRNRWD